MPHDPGVPSCYKVGVEDDEIYEVALAVSRQPSAERIADAMIGAKEHGRRHGERWTEIAVAHWLREEAYRETEPLARGALLAHADLVDSRGWRRPELQSGVDLEAEAAEAMRIVAKKEKEGSF